MDAQLVTSVSEDFAATDLGDKRLTRRLMRIADAAERAPGARLPHRAGSSAALEGTYRFFANDKVTPEAVFNAHVEATIRRSTAGTEVLVIHDTTEFRFGGQQPRDGMGWINSNNELGFLAHFSICVDLSGQPLGSLPLYAWARQGARVGRRKSTNDIRNPDRESHRWQESALRAAELLQGKTNVIHVMDREGDQFELLSLLIEHEQRFVVRVAHDRRLETGRGRSETPKLFESLVSSPHFFNRDVAIGARAKPDGSNKTDVYPIRKSRIARLEVRAVSREIFTAHTAPAHVPKSLTLNVVEAREVDVPQNEAPIIWRTVTTEPIATREQVALIVDIYRQRWLIEEFFKALKTGCRYQQLQLEASRGLLIALSIEVAVSWRLLALRWAAQHRPEADALSVLPADDLQLLQALCAAETGRRASDKLDVREALNELARLGGHIKNNGTPGWFVLRRGLDTLITIRRGWALTRGPWS